MAREYFQVIFVFSSTSLINSSFFRKDITVGISPSPSPSFVDRLFSVLSKTPMAPADAILLPRVSPSVSSARFPFLSSFSSFFLLVHDSYWSTIERNNSICQKGVSTKSWIIRFYRSPCRHLSFVPYSDIFGRSLKARTEDNDFLIHEFYPNYFSYPSLVFLLKGRIIIQGTAGDALWKYI